tara:strand:- start:4127 stop:5008 length:882 start_codon:yes stop_codon:yes gene_type:complete
VSKNEKQISKLGRGLDAVFGRSFVGGGRTIVEIPVEKIKANDYQPRTMFDESALNKLINSINKNGLAQPILVRPLDGGFYELIAGERRLRACRMAGFKAVPAIIKDVSNLESLQLALVENLDREDLNALEEAEGYQRLISEFNYTHSMIADLFGKSRSAVTNLLRLISLPDNVKSAIQHNLISEGHARALLGLDNKANIGDLLKQIIDDRLSVRDVENKVASFNNQTEQLSMLSSEEEVVIDKHMPFFDRIKTNCLEKGVTVKCSGSIKKGRVSFSYSSEDELYKLVDLFSPK